MNHNKTKRILGSSGDTALARKDAFLVVSTLISNILTEKFKGKAVTKSLQYEIYQSIFDTLVEVMTQSGVQLSNEAMNFTSQWFYDGVSLNNSNDECLPDIFTQRPSVKNLKTEDLAMIAAMFSSCDLGKECYVELLKVR